MKLAGYVLGLVSVRILASILVLLGVLQIIDLIEVTNQIVSRGLGFGGVLHYVLLRLPRLVDQAAPLGVLAGVIFAFMKLAGESAIVAMRAAGVSSYRLTAFVLPAALAVALLDFVSVELIAPRTDPALQAWWRDTAPATQKIDAVQRAFRVGGDLVLATTTDLSGHTLRDVKIYRRDPEGRLVERISSAEAQHVRAGGWRLAKPRFVRLGPDGARTWDADSMVWTGAFEPIDVQALFSPDQMLSAASAGRALSGGGAERPPSYYATRVQRALAHPLGAVVMLLLATPIALANFRSGQGGAFVTGSIGAGLSFLVVDGLFSAMGESGAVAPIFGAWAAPVMFAALGVTALLKLEG